VDHPPALADREGVWAALKEAPLDLLIIGGGITGVGIARDAAGRGIRVGLVEAGDVGEGSSSRSSRLIHGGLRYLETFEFGLVFEALRERRRLLEVAPHLVRPLPFLFPVYGGDATGLAKLATGMLLYESLSLLRSPKKAQILRRDGALRAEPMLRSQGLRGGALYYDAQVDDARLTISVARAAHDAGASILSHASIIALDLTIGSGGIAVVRDRFTGREQVVRAKLVVNAAGPWSDRVRRLADPRARERLRMTKGAHILVARDRVANLNAVIFRSYVDGRVMFVLPWGRFTYIGTTDTAYSGDPADSTADPEDIRYLIDSANGIFPAARLRDSDVISTWAGVRPLLAPTRSAGVSESATSREHAIWRDSSGLLNVAGGKLTTFRSMAAEATDEAAAILEREFGLHSGKFYTDLLPLPGGDEMPQAISARLETEARSLGIDGEALTALISRHGTEVEALLLMVRQDVGLARRLVPGLDYLWVEAVFAVRVEGAATLEDVLRRRLHVFYELADGGLSIAAEVANALAFERSLRWDGAEVSKQLETYADAVRTTRPGGSLTTS